MKKRKGVRWKEFTSRKNQGKLKFTLIELLVVITILAILAALLLPAMRKVWNKAHSVSCLSQQRQFLQLTGVYAADFKDSYPFTHVYADPTEIGYDKGLGRNYGLLVDLDYLNNKTKLFICPANNRVKVTASGRINGHQSSYTWLPMLSKTGGNSADPQNSKYCATMTVSQKPAKEGVVVGRNMVVLLDTVPAGKWNTGDLMADMHWDHYNVGRVGRRGQKLHLRPHLARMGLYGALRSEMVIGKKG